MVALHDIGVYFIMFSRTLTWKVNSRYIYLWLGIVVESTIIRVFLKMAEKAKNMSHVKHIPKDAQVIMSIMKDMGITDYDSKVINQLLEFTYRK